MLTSDQKTILKQDDLTALLEIALMLSEAARHLEKLHFAYTALSHLTDTERALKTLIDEQKTIVREAKKQAEN